MTSRIDLAGALAGVLILLAFAAGWSLKEFWAGDHAEQQVASAEAPPLPSAPVTEAEPQNADPSGSAARSAATGIDPVAMRAYVNAASRLAAEQPGCGLGWSTLAGIGMVESRHGTSGGARLLEDGTTSKPIIGPALDGTGGFAALRPTEQSRAWHGDEESDHAVGPMQFIGSTWQRWGSDADGDGRADPHDLDDAAYSAARYLCAEGRNLRAGTAWSQAVFSYNHSADYVHRVWAYADRYARLASP